MSLAAGHLLSNYRITAPLGAGGMGEVYRATDTKLGREVALKLLPDAFAADSERLARFEREAKLLASLNHPGIAHLYGFDAVPSGDGSRAHVLVMELVEGEDLAARLSRGPIPPDEAIAIARQVAEALEEAHEKGIVHRDLKPANVKVTPEGKVKVLDFGLAKAWSDEGAGTTSSADLSQSPTLAHTGTAAGLILGTAAYMSPEQARGRAVDKRADIWAFGVLLYEMLTARRLFGGETVSDTLASVLKTDPDWSALPAGTPARAADAAAALPRARCEAAPARHRRGARRPRRHGVARAAGSHAGNTARAGGVAVASGVGRAGARRRGLGGGGHRAVDAPAAGAAARRDTARHPATCGSCPVGCRRPRDLARRPNAGVRGAGCHRGRAPLPARAGPLRGTPRS